MKVARVVGVVMTPQNDEMCSLTNAYNAYSIVIILSKTRGQLVGVCFTVLLRPVS